jgi:hypothetical protein
VDVGLDGWRIVERPHPNEADAVARVATDDGDRERRAQEDPLHAAVVARDGGLAGEALDSVRLDEHAVHERAPRPALAVEAMTAMDEERPGREPVPDRRYEQPFSSWTLKTAPECTRAQRGKFIVTPIERARDKASVAIRNELTVNFERREPFMTTTTAEPVVELDTVRSQKRSGTSITLDTHSRAIPALQDTAAELVARPRHG